MHTTWLHFIYTKIMGGRVNQIDIPKDSGPISPDLHHYGDQILADCGLTLEGELVAGRGLGLLIPSFTKGKNQLSSKDGVISSQIASVCIHLEKQT